MTPNMNQEHDNKLKAIAHLCYSFGLEVVEIKLKPKAYQTFLHDYIHREALQSNELKKIREMIGDARELRIYDTKITKEE